MTWRVSVRRSKKTSRSCKEIDWSVFRNVRKMIKQLTKSPAKLYSSRYVYGYSVHSFEWFSCLQTEVGGISRKKHDAEQRIKHYRDQVSEIQRNVLTMEAILAEKEEMVTTATHAAQEVSPEILTERSSKSIRVEIKKLMELVALELPDQEEQEAVEAQYVEAMERFKNTRKAIRKEERALKVNGKGYV